MNFASPFALALWAIIGLSILGLPEDDGERGTQVVSGRGEELFLEAGRFLPGAYLG